MKTLKRNSEIKRVKDTSKTDIDKMESMLKSGWSFCPKSEWKATKPKVEPKPEKKDGGRKRGKNS